MALRNSAAAYGSIAKLFHWLLALAILAMLILGVVIAFAAPTPQKGQIITFHKSLGLSVLIFMIVRLLWRLSNPSPQMPQTVPLSQQRLIKLIYSLLYFCVLATTLIGWSMSALSGHTTRLWGLVNVTLPLTHNYLWQQRTEALHEFLGWAIAILIALHVTIFIWHHVVKGNKLLKRMWPRKQYNPQI
ncbi:MAG: cytochrome b [Gammaproteobacteria bacterium]|nr:cytochrome b [Gammaproteobacteria bacterium]